MIMTAIMAISVLFLYSSRIEKSRVVTISKPLLITQVRRTPAFALYQQAQNFQNKKSEIIAESTTFLNTESAKAILKSVDIAEMKFDRREISSAQDAGFQVAWNKQTTAENSLSSLSQETVFNEAPVIQVQQNSSPLKKWGTIRGKFEVKDGVGVVDHIVEVKRTDEGQTHEQGHVDLKAGTYSIDIENPQGYLIAEIKDQNGTVIGVDQQKIINLASHGNYFDGPFIRVGPPAQVGANPSIPNGNSGTAIASNGRSRGSAKPDHQAPSTITASLFSAQHQLSSPKEQFGNISKNSATISLIEDQKNVYAKTISIRQTGDEIETPLFRKNWLLGTLEYISDHQKLEFKSKKAPVLIGRIFVNGKPTQGAKVQIENHPGINAIYLDQFMIPNFSQEGTSDNGYFLFVGLEPDNYSAVAFQNNKIIGQQTFVAEENIISYQHIVFNSTPRSVLVRSFDALTGLPVDADIIASDLEDIIETERGTATYRTQNSLGVANYIVRPKDNYMPINYIQDTRMDYVHIPAIHESWLAAIQSKLQINDEISTGTLIGFVPDIDYEMYIISETYDRNQIVYFNQAGEVMKTPTLGGGFIMFNVPVGAQEVVVQQKKTERIYSQVYFVKANQTSVSHFSE